MAALMALFGLYLVVFSAFGLLASALTHRRMTAFLSLLGLWTIWIFILPDMAVYAARRLMPTESPVALQRRSDALLWEIGEKREAEVNRYWESNPVKDWDGLPESRKRELLEGRKKILDRWDAEHWRRLAGMREEYRNQMRRQQRLSAALSAISPLGAVTFASMDLARTGFIQQERIEDALGVQLAYMGKFVRQKEALPVGRPSLMDYSRFTYQDHETVEECFSRNALHILNLALLAILGFAGAYVAILRYDVR
jgi:hypothetical protein